ncbi:hypothetical protein [Streptomyces sp. NPDC000229]|uniref:hypothetical protein n=1 Tax=Streptomyces sp. NPDC000229 TaxID=3154247 RepID=UPI003317D0C9
MTDTDGREPAIVEAPSVLGLRPSGVQDLPTALRDAGLADRLGAVRAGRVDPPPYDPGARRRHRDPQTALADERARVLDVTIFNPRLDPGGRIAARLTECLVRGLAARTDGKG